MKNYMVLMIALLVLSKTGIAQTPKDSTVSKKNEFTVDLIPLIKWASTSNGVFDVKGTLQYKRQLKSHMFLRLGVTVVQERVEREFTDIRFTLQFSITMKYLTQAQLLNLSYI